MTSNPEDSRALHTALAYHRAWTGRDMDTAMAFIAEDIVCHAPAGTLRGARAFREFMGPFTQIVTDARLIAAFGDDEHALVMYDTSTIPVAEAPGAEWVTVSNGKIREMTIIFDRLPFELARRTSASA